MLTVVGSEDNNKAKPMVVESIIIVGSDVEKKLATIKGR